MFGRDFRLDPAPAFAVSGDNNFSFDRHSQAVELFVIFAVPVVHIHQRSGHISIRRIRVVCGKLFAGLLGRRIHRESRFLQFRYEFFRLD